MSHLELFTVSPVGVVQSPLKTTLNAPKQGSESGVEGTVVVYDEYSEALLGIAPGQKIVLLCWMHLADRGCLQVHPRGDKEKPLRGVFLTRSPDRPNPIGLEDVEVIAVDGTSILVRGLDVLDGTPVIDIKKHL